MQGQEPEALWIAERDVPELGIDEGDVITRRPTPSGHVWAVHQRRSLTIAIMLSLEVAGVARRVDVTPRSTCAAPAPPSAVARALRPRERSPQP